MRAQNAKTRYNILMDYNKLALELHQKYKGKITTALRDNGEIDRDKLSAYYSPGVGAVSQAIAENSAILGLGDLGPKAAMPVMEGKALLFKHFANVDAVPIVLDVHEPEEIIAAVKAIAPSFGAINLEDIASPKCFEIEERLKAELDIPVFHDDQHGTAIVVLAGLINAAKVVDKNLRDCKVVLAGPGAAGTAIIKLLNLYGVKNLIALDRHGALSSDRTDLSPEKTTLQQYLNTSESGTLAEVLNGADIFVGVSAANSLAPEMVAAMASQPIIFALANPVPEIMPDAAISAGAAVVATGRSDFPNQVNNSLAFPGIFRGALDHGVQKITDQHKLAAAEALAALVENPTADEVIPSPFDKRVVPAVANVIK